MWKITTRIELLANNELFLTPYDRYFGLTVNRKFSRRHTHRSKVDSGCLCFVNEWQFLSSKGMIKIMKEASVVKGSGDWHDTREISYSPKISKDKRGLGTVHGWNRRFTYVTTYTPIRIAFRHKSATEKLRG